MEHIEEILNAQSIESINTYAVGIEQQIGLHSTEENPDTSFTSNLTSLLVGSECQLQAPATENEITGNLTANYQDNGFNIDNTAPDCIQQVDFYTADEIPEPTFACYDYSNPAGTLTDKNLLIDFGYQATFAENSISGNQLVIEATRKSKENCTAGANYPDNGLNLESASSKDDNSRSDIHQLQQDSNAGGTLNDLGLFYQNFGCQLEAQSAENGNQLIIEPNYQHNNEITSSHIDNMISTQRDGNSNIQNISSRNLPLKENINDQHFNQVVLIEDANNGRLNSMKRKRESDDENELPVKRPALDDIKPSEDRRERYVECIACDMQFYTLRTLKKHFKTKSHIYNVANKKIVDPAQQKETWIRAIYKCNGEPSKPCHMHYRTLAEVERHYLKHHYRIRNFIN